MAVRTLRELAREIDDRYFRVMEKMTEAGTWTDEVNERFEHIYEGFSLRLGKYLTP